jgi:nitrile hydratase
MPSEAHAGDETLASVRARFATGDRVRVLRMYPLGHVRTPWYIRGKVAWSERVCGVIETGATRYGRSGLPAEPPVSRAVSPRRGADYAAATRESTGTQIATVKVRARGEVNYREA